MDHISIHHWRSRESNKLVYGLQRFLVQQVGEDMHDIILDSVKKGWDINTKSTSGPEEPSRFRDAVPSKSPLLKKAKADRKSVGGLIGRSLNMWKILKEVSRVPNCDVKAWGIGAGNRHFGLVRTVNKKDHISTPGRQAHCGHDSWVVNMRRKSCYRGVKQAYKRMHLT